MRATQCLRRILPVVQYRDHGHRILPRNNRRWSPPLPSPLFFLCLWILCTKYLVPAVHNNTINVVR